MAQKKIYFNIGKDDPFICKGVEKVIVYDNDKISIVFVNQKYINIFANLFHVNFTIYDTTIFPDADVFEIKNWKKHFQSFVIH